MEPMVVDEAMLDSAHMEAVEGVEGMFRVTVGYLMFDGSKMRGAGKASAVTRDHRLYAAVRDAVFPEVPGRKPSPRVRFELVPDGLSAFRLVSFENKRTGEKWP